MTNDVKTKLGNVLFSFDGDQGEAKIDEKVVYKVDINEIDNYSRDATTFTEYLIALIEMFIRDGGRLHEN